jgi:N-acetylmuramic acid 6-phosphate etherase
MTLKKLTEADSHYHDLEKMPVAEMLTGINREDQTVALAVEREIPRIAAFVEALIPRMKAGGRLFYIGAGTSGRLGIVDASECPPTFGVPHDWVIGLMAGGDDAMRKAVEFAEDDAEGAWRDLASFYPSNLDTLVGIAASGTTPYVIGGLRHARVAGLLTACICCNSGSPVASSCEYPIEVLVGPEFVTGSTRMKAGTAQKLVLNMISTSTMIGLGRIRGNKMVDMQLSNNKLIERGTRMIVEVTGIDADEAARLLNKFGSVRDAVDHILKTKNNG